MDSQADMSVGDEQEICEGKKVEKRGVISYIKKKIVGESLVNS
jgi:hypothetical protein